MSAINSMRIHFGEEYPNTVLYRCMHSKCVLNWNQTETGTVQALDSL